MSRQGYVLQVVGPIGPEGPQGPRGDPGADGPAGDPTIRVLRAVTITSPEADDDVTLYFAAHAFTITRLVAVVRGTTPSVTWTVRFDADRSAVGSEVVVGGTTTTSQTGGASLSSFTDATIPANAFVWLEVTAASGTVNEFHLDLFGTED